MFDKPRCRELLSKYLEGTIDSREQDELFKMTADGNIEGLLTEMIDDDFSSDQPGYEDLPPIVANDILKRILASEKNTDRLFTLQEVERNTR